MQVGVISGFGPHGSGCPMSRLPLSRMAKRKTCRQEIIRHAVVKEGVRAFNGYYASVIFLAGYAIK